MQRFKDLLNHLLPHLWPFLVFFLIVSVYFFPLYEGKTLVQSDNIQLSGTLSEVNDYKAQGETIRWSNREFSGMPVLAGSNYNVFRYLNEFLFYGAVPKPIMMVLVLFAGMYLLLSIFKPNTWVNAIISFAYAFSTFNFLSIEAGHDNKVIAISLMAPVLAGIILAYRGKYLTATFLTTVFAGLELYYGHVQITYYLLIVVIGYVILVFYQHYKENNLTDFFKASAFLLVATVLATGANLTKMLSLIEYSDYSTRGGSELTQTGASSTGLNKEYALAWSNGIVESMTIVFPYLYGGASGETLKDNSNTADALATNNVPQATINSILSSAPLYWGNQPFTGGPIYFGAILCFLFIMGFMVIKDHIKWWVLTIFLISLMLSMGKNLVWFTDIFFYYVPLYNKFRSVTMILAVSQLMVAFFAGLVLNQLIDGGKDQKVLQKLKWSTIGFLGFGFLFLLFRGAFDFVGQNDANYQFPDWLMRALIDDRKALFTSGVIRSLVFVGICAGVLWFFLNQRLKLSHTLGLIGVLVLIDLWTVDRRYISSDDFESGRREQSTIPRTVADDQILSNDSESYYRVFNTTRDPFKEGITSYRHYSIGGYSAIKMQRYQELIDRYLQAGNLQILSALNARYFIVSGPDNQILARRNTQALGNAWLVRNMEEVENADSEIQRIGEVELSTTAIYDKRFSNYFDGSAESYTGVGNIVLQSYHPEQMVYTFNSDSDQFVVFSEIYYQPGWNAYIDGSEVDHIRVNYVLRGLKVPAGEHTIEFRYEPKSVVIGKPVTATSSFLILGLCGLLLFRAARSRNQ